MKIAYVIPARFKSKRLPGKPLKKILGVPMILRTARQCLKVIPRQDLFIVTDNRKIMDLCKKNNLNAALITKRCLTGTDRVAHFAKINKKYTNYINIQGDEPIFNPQDLKKIQSFTKKNSKTIFGGYCQINNKKDYYSPSIPKIIISKKKNLLYMSRAAIPSNKKKKFVKAFRQVCIYSFPKKTLGSFLKFKEKTFFENIEDLELLRFIENGIKVKMIKMSNKSISVDIPGDIKKVENMIKKNQK